MDTAYNNSFSWDHFLSCIKSDLDLVSYEGWILPLSFIEIEGSTLVIECPSMYIKNWVNTNYKEIILNIIKINFPYIKDFIINIATSPEHEIKNDTIDNFSSLNLSNEAQIENASEIKLNPKYTFDNFVVGTPNEFAYNACKRVATDDKATFNPLFIHGGVGLGKTHLMHSIAWEIKNRDPKKQIMYVTAEKFMSLFVSALSDRSVISFKELFRSKDVLMIDDFQFISGKDGTQSEFFHTLNSLVSEGKQMVLSADRSPLDLDRIEERIISRLQGGLSVNISETTYELRLGIIAAKAKNMSINLPYEVMEFIAHAVTTNVRELEGAFNKVVLYHQIMNTPITLNMAMHVLNEIIKHNNKPISIETIQKKVAEHYNIKLADMSSTKKDKVSSSARHVAMYISKQLTNSSLPEIGRKFGKRDHTTVLYSVRKIEERLRKDQLLENDIRILTNIIQKS